MTKKEAFIDYVKSTLETNTMNEDAKIYWEALQETEDKEKSLISEKGKTVLRFLQDHSDKASWKSKEIAESLCIGSRSVSGSMRGLVSTKLVEKIGENPAVYTLTEVGKAYQLDNE